MDDLHTLSIRLRQIAAEPPSPERRAEALVGLQSKWEGAQAIALDALGGWGGPDSIAVLQRFLVDAFDREAGWSIRGVAVRNLIPLVTAADAPWVLDLYFRLPGALAKHELLELVITLPPEAARQRLTAELSSTEPTNRHAAVKAIGNMPYSDRRTLLHGPRGDPDAFVSESARYLAKDA